jgi:hypothetical protein
MSTHNPKWQIPAEVDQYVTKNRGWRPSDYRIREEGREGKLVRYVVTYVPEEKTPRIGGGKSFAVYYDPAVRKVVRELYFQ